jgi:hypothetical protein
MMSKWLSGTFALSESWNILKRTPGGTLSVLFKSEISFHLYKVVAILIQTRINAESGRLLVFVHALPENAYRYALWYPAQDASLYATQDIPRPADPTPYTTRKEAVGVDARPTHVLPLLPAQPPLAHP